ncbi:MAG: tetratricopeptide repeat protein [Myxococcales bacterium]|nr:tetratricopeptide repeat protein [Myxococcales bacterium]
MTRSPLRPVLFASILVTLLGGCRGAAQRDADAGLRLQLAGKLREAIARYEKALHREPSLDRVGNNLGVALYLRGERDRALKRFLDAAKRSRSPWPPFNAGVVMLRAHKWQQALRYLAQARRLSPTTPSIRLWLWIAELRAGRGPSDPPTGCEKLPPPIWLELGRYWLSSGKRAAGRACIERSLRREPQNALPPLLLALDSIRHHELKAARRVLRHAVAKLRAAGKRVAELHAVLGAVELGLGELVLARRELELALALDAQLIDASYLLGLVALRQREWETALKAFRAEIARDKRHRDALYGAALATFRLKRYQRTLSWLERLARVGAPRRPALQLRLDAQRLAPRR